MDATRDEPKPSDSLTFTNTLPFPDSLNLNLEHYNAETAQEEDDYDQTGEESLRLDLMLSGYDSSQPQLNQELNLIDCLDAIVVNGSSSTEQKIFSCNYCQRTFYSSQALGGHQNAHKRERTLAKRGQMMASAADFVHPYGYAPVPFHGQYSNSSLGIQAHSMNHCLSSYNVFGGEYSEIDWSRIPAIGKLSSTVNHHQMMVASTSENFGGFDVGKIPVEFPTPELWRRGGELLKKPAEEEHQKNLDLSLKL